MDNTYTFFGFLTWVPRRNDPLTVSSNTYTLVSTFSAVGIRGFSHVSSLTQAGLELFESHFSLCRPIIEVWMFTPSSFLYLISRYVY